MATAIGIQKPSFHPAVTGPPDERQPRQVNDDASVQRSVQVGPPTLVLRRQQAQGTHGETGPPHLWQGRLGKCVWRARVLWAVPVCA